MYICLRARKGKKERVLQKSFANSEKNSRLFNLFPLLSLSLSTPSLNTGPRQGWQSRRGRRGPQGRQGSQGELAVSIREEFVFPAPSSPSLSRTSHFFSLSLSLSLSVSPSTPSLNTGPRGRRGPQGRQGPQGPQGELAVSIREELFFLLPLGPLSLAPLTSFLSLSLSPPHFLNTGPRGRRGPQGRQGPQGQPQARRGLSRRG